MLQKTQNLEQMLETLEAPDEIYATEIIPSESPYMQSDDVLGWQHSLYEEISQTIAEYCSRDQQEDFTTTLLYAVENAWMHGNKQNAEQPIEVHIYSGQHGLLFEVCDQGCGFDVESTIGAFYHTTESSDVYYHNLGMGMETFEESLCLISYNDYGNTCYGVLRFEDLDR
jgi:anti-sigma regulatory factor (Ser/Thr protein kinase)